MRLEKNWRLLRLLRLIPKGRVTTYKIIGEKAGVGPRQAGWILKNNARPDLYPCYKVIKSDGRLGGYAGSQKKNIKKKIKLLEKDGIKISRGKVVGFSGIIWEFDGRDKKQVGGLSGF
ncbi:MAG: MGMT family protein [Patescibacteria group bacterium]|nr:MGMT family protein [Patescibacteria group bacterium]